jgi:hypothetical protein
MRVSGFSRGFMRVSCFPAASSRPPLKPDPQLPEGIPGSRVREQQHPPSTPPGATQAQDDQPRGRPRGMCRPHRMLPPRPVPPPSGAVLLEFHPDHRAGKAQQGIRRGAGRRNRNARADQCEGNSREACHGRRQRQQMGSGQDHRQGPGGLQLDAAGRQTLVNIRVPLVPPNPKEFDSAARIGMRRAVPGT